MKKIIFKKMFILPFILIVLAAAILLSTMAVPRIEGDWEINEYRITEDLYRSLHPSLVYVGTEDTEYAIVWNTYNYYTNNTPVYFARLDASGNIIGEIVDNLISDAGETRLVWTGTEYAIIYTNNNILYFTRLDAMGNRIGDDIEVMDFGFTVTSHSPVLIWTGTEYAIAWDWVDWARGSVTNIYMARLDPLGNRIGDIINVTDDLTGANTQPSLVFTGNEYGIVWERIDGLYFSKINIDSEGTVTIEDRIRITESNSTTGSSDLAWAETKYGISWTTNTYEIYFLEFDRDGNPIGDETILSNGQYSSLVWTGNHYGSLVENFGEINFVEINTDNNEVNSLRISSTSTPLIDFSNDSIVWTGDKYAVVWQDERDGNYEIYFADLKKALTGRHPSIYKNRLVYEKNGDIHTDIYMYDILEETETVIASGPARQINPQIYENIIVWQEEREVTTEEYAFNFPGLIDNCYAIEPATNYENDIYMYNIDTGETTLVTGEPEEESNPAIYGDYIVWAVGRPGSPAETNVIDIGIYKISTGEKWMLSSRLDDLFDIRLSLSLDSGGAYALAGNILTFSNHENTGIPPRAWYQSDQFTYVYNLSNDTIVEKIDEGTIVDSIMWINPSALGGEKFFYRERVSMEPTERGTYISHFLLKAYNLTNSEVIDLGAEIDIDDGMGIPVNNCMSGDKFVYRDTNLPEPSDEPMVALKLYDLVEGTSRTLVTGLTGFWRPGSELNELGRFDIWGNRVVYSYYSPEQDENKIRIITLDSNSNTGNDVMVALGSGISVQYDEVRISGETILETFPADTLGGGYEGQFRLATGEVFNISSSAVTQGSTYITLDYSTYGLTDSDAEDLGLSHWDETTSPAAWVSLERTAIDYDANTATFLTNSLSPFVMGLPPNRPPVLEPIGNKTVDENARLEFAISASDPDGDPIIYSASRLPFWASFNPATRTFSWTPRYNQAGTYSVTFTASDGELSSSETITITVNNINRPPRLYLPSTRSVFAGSELVFIVFAIDPDGDRLTYTADTLPEGASFSAVTRIFRWRPTDAQAGRVHTARFTVSDNGTPVLSNSKNVRISVLRRPGVR